jgi:hypothetical protein
MATLIHGLKALGIALGSILILFACYFLISGSRPGPFFALIMKSVGFILGFAYYFSTPRGKKSQ